jgi:hypothetical protein
MATIGTVLWFDGVPTSQTGVPANYSINVSSETGNDVELGIRNVVEEEPGTVDPLCYQFQVDVVRYSFNNSDWFDAVPDADYTVDPDIDYRTVIDLSWLMDSHAGHLGCNIKVIGHYVSCNVPGTVTLLSPSNDYTHDGPVSIRLTWEYNGSLPLTSYTYQSVHVDNEEITVVRSESLPSNVSHFDDYFNRDYGYYRWTVVANGADGSTPEEKQIERRVYIRPEPPVALSPSGIIGPTNPVTFTWAPVTGATRYEIVIKWLSGFVIAQELVTDTSYSTSLADGDYTWQVRAYNSENEPSVWTDPMAFTFMTGGEFSTPDIVPLEWDEVPGAVLYELEIYPNQGGDRVLHETLTETEFNWSCVGASDLYRWRVRPYAGSEWGSWSEPVIFKYNCSFMPCDYTPAPNANGVVTSNAIGAIFNVPVEESSITPDSYLLVGEQSGAIPHTVGLYGEPWVQAFPTLSYRSGERVTATMTSGISSTTPGDNLDPGRSFSFTTASTGNADFYHEDRITLPHGGWESCIADLNGDGDLDIAVAHGLNKTISVALSDGEGGYHPHTEYNAGPEMFKSYNTQGIVAADVDGDGDLDLVSANYTDYSISVYANDGSGGFGVGTVSRMLDTSNSAPTDIHAADFDNDGDLDIICGSTSCVLVFENLGGSGFELDVPRYATTGHAQSICLGDMNNDGLIDVAARDWDTGEVSKLINAGDGTFGNATTFPWIVADPTAVDCADVDGDHFLDLAVVSYSLTSNQVRVFKNDGAGGFAGYSDYTVPGDRLVSVAFFDANGDAYMDLVVGKEGDLTVPEDLMLLLNDGAGQFGSPVPFDLLNGDGFTSFKPKALDVGDMDGDGTVDLVATDFSEPAPETVILYNLMAPGAVTLYSPLDGKDISHTNPVLDWVRLPGFGVEYTVQLDDDANFTSPVLRELTTTDHAWTVTPALPEGTYYWRVLATNPVGVGPSSEVRSLVVDVPDPSCPVLYTYDGSGFVYENPLLTACEASGYRDIVTDYYMLAADPAPDGGQLRFELRELEDEITYLSEVELLVVDYPKNNFVTCTAAGDVVLHRQVIAPVAAVDQDGRDVLEVIAAKDGNIFDVEGDGHMIVSFPRLIKGAVFSTNAPPKPPCPDPASGDPAGESRDPGLTFAIRSPEGEWQDVADLPSRQLTREEAFTSETGSGDGEGFDIRISWSAGFKTDAILQYIPAAEEPIVRKQAPADHALRVHASAGVQGGALDQGHPLELRKGDVLSFSFDAGASVADGLKRAYVIKAVGRYEPDYAVHTSMTPTRNVMHGNFPNPFNPSTVFRFDLAAEASVSLKIYDVRGRLVRSLVAGELYGAGAHSISWNGRDNIGNSIASGTYYYRFEAGSYRYSGSVQLVK